jgi:hypothetical protein
MASKIQPKTEKKGRIGERERERRRNSSLLSIQHSPKELKKKKKKNQKKKKKSFQTGKKSDRDKSWGEINHFVGFTNFRMFFFPGPPTV